MTDFEKRQKFVVDMEKEAKFRKILGACFFTSILVVNKMDKDKPNAKRKALPSATVENLDE